MTRPKRRLILAIVATDSTFDRAELRGEEVWARRRQRWRAPPE